MSQCEYIRTCRFFNDNLPQMPSTAELLKVQYCKRDWARCARYVIATRVSRDRVPPDLYPGDIQRAEKILLDG